jgi:hypothetical protein
VGDRVESTKRVTVRLEEEDYKDLVKASEELGITKSDVIRLSLQDNMGDRKVINVGAQDKAKLLTTMSSLFGLLSEAEGQMIPIGRNINQIAKVANTSSSLSESEYSDLLKELNVLRKQYHDLEVLEKEVHELWQQFV